MSKALITTVPFGDKNRLPLELLERAEIDYLINPLNKKLIFLQEKDTTHFQKIEKDYYIGPYMCVCLLSQLLLAWSRRCVRTWCTSSHDKHTHITTTRTTVILVSHLSHRKHWQC